MSLGSYQNGNIIHIFQRNERFACNLFSEEKLMSTQKLALNRMQKLCSIIRIYYSNWPSQNKKSIYLYVYVGLCTPRPFFSSPFSSLPYTFRFAKAIIKHTHFRIFSHL